MGFRYSGGISFHEIEHGRECYAMRLEDGEWMVDNGEWGN
jgi:hypothetical protein